MERDIRNREQLRELRKAHGDAEAGLSRLLELVEKGLMDAQDPALRERLVKLRFQRDELAGEISEMTRRLAAAEPEVTPEKVERFAVTMRKHLHEGAPELRQAYVRLLLRDVSVTQQQIRITGSKTVLARSAAEGLSRTAPAVLSFVQEWRARQDSNL